MAYQILFSRRQKCSKANSLPSSFLGINALEMKGSCVPEAVALNALLNGGINWGDFCLRSRKAKSATVYGIRFEQLVIFH
ncbi:hypothetical protein JL49_17125 [Pseudoalteromonas luteoviolacea]|nr:hypothetical protein JL49_17125 [Pseudoalteromonas luteoviolacea]